MDSNRWKKIEALLDQALELPADKRIEFLKSNSEDEELFKAASKLLHSIEEATHVHFMEPGSLDRNEVLNDINVDNISSESQLVGTDLGKFTITEVLGRGGMATVFKGERRDKTVNQTVAIKILHSSLHSQESLIRFRMEQEILANLNHPNIAHFIDAGVTKEDNPYFIMEYVEGMPIDEYCQQKNLDKSQKLELYKQLCKAVSFAHRNLVVHRDLKPGNIFVNQDEIVKVLDFSIAKLLDPDFSDQTLIHTQEGTKLLSPTYCAPEQFQMDPITTATDVYTLGLVLYEMFSGQKALDGKNKTLKEIQATICSNDFSKTLQVEHDSELKAIIHKATRKEPEYRYESAGQLLEDLKRYEDSMPLLAQKDSAKYRISKFVKRHARAVSAILLILVSSGLFITFHIQQISKERELAEVEANKATQALNLMTGIFEEASPYYHGSDDLTADEILRRGTEYVKSDSNSQPLVKATIFESLGTIYITLGNFGQADTLFNKALTIYQEDEKNEKQGLANSYMGLGQVGIETTNYDTSHYYLEKAEKLYKEIGDSVGFARAVQHKSWYYKFRGLNNIADSLIMISLRINKDKFGFESEEVATDYGALGFVRFGEKRWIEADSLFRIALKIRRNVHGDDHPTVVRSLNAIGDNLVDYFSISKDTSLIPKASKALDEALSIGEQIIIKPHPLIGLVHHNLGQLDFFTGNQEEALKHFNLALDQYLPTYGKDHHQTMNVENSMARIYFANQEFEKVVELMKRHIRLTKKKFGPVNPELATSYNNLAYTYQRMGKLSEALDNYINALSIGRKVFEPGHPYLVLYRVNAIRLYEELEDYQKALELTYENLETLRDNEEMSYSTLGDNYYRLSKLHEKLGEQDKAREFRLKREAYQDSLQSVNQNKQD